jgi:hypothetical protein
VERVIRVDERDRDTGCPAARFQLSQCMIWSTDDLPADATIGHHAQVVVRWKVRLQPCLGCMDNDCSPAASGGGHVLSVGQQQAQRFPQAEVPGENRGGEPAQPFADRGRRS